MISEIQYVGVGGFFLGLLGKKMEGSQGASGENNKKIPNLVIFQEVYDQ